MRVEFDLAGKTRKEFVKAISEITGINAVYCGVPTCSYDIGSFTVTKNSALEFPDDLELIDLFDRLSEKGFMTYGQSFGSLGQRLRTEPYSRRG